MSVDSNESRKTEDERNANVEQRQKELKPTFGTTVFDGPSTLLGHGIFVGFQDRCGFSSRNSMNLFILAWNLMGYGHRAIAENPVANKCLQRAQNATFASIVSKQKKKRESPRTKKVQPETHKILDFERVVERENYFKFVVKAKDFIAKQPEQVIQLDEAGKLHRELGFPRGKKVRRSIENHPALFQLYRHTDGKMWLGFTSLMEKLLEEEGRIMDEMEGKMVTTVRKLLMMSADKRIPLNKIHHCRLIFGLPDDFRHRVHRYPQFFKVVEEQGSGVLELRCWEPALAVTTLEASYIGNEDKIKKAFVFPVRHAKHLKAGKGGIQKLNILNTIPLVSPYSDTSSLNPKSLEEEKYRVGLIHEFLSLTLEKKASIHHLAEFREEFRLTKDTYHLLLKQSRVFYLAGTEMNWTVFLKDAYRGQELIEKDPLVVFKEKLYCYGYLKRGDPKFKEIISANALNQDEGNEEEDSKQGVKSGEISEN